MTLHYLYITLIIWKVQSYIKQDQSQSENKMDIVDTAMTCHGDEDEDGDDMDT